MKKFYLVGWVSLQRRRKWGWVAKLAITETDDWTTQTLRWDPTLDMQHNTRRRQGRPKTRWTDDIYNHIRSTQHDSTTDTNNHTDNTNDTTITTVDANTILRMAKDEEAWLAMEEGFVKRSR